MALLLKLMSSRFTYLQCAIDNGLYIMDSDKYMAASVASATMLLGEIAKHPPLNTDDATTLVQCVQGAPISQRDKAKIMEAIDAKVAIGDGPMEAAIAEHWPTTNTSNATQHFVVLQHYLSCEEWGVLRDPTVSVTTKLRCAANKHLQVNGV